MITRRMFHLLGGSVFAAATSAVASKANATQVAPSAADTFTRDWVLFRDRFVQRDGRVADYDNGGVSHSEGQGWALMFAARANDRTTFESVLSWTERTLCVRGDGLHAWRYVPGEGVSDLNNATDGDIFIALALARAAQQWNIPAYRGCAAVIAEAVIHRLVRRIGGQTILLPGSMGFERAAEVIVNPSYYPFFAIAELARLGHADIWSRVWLDGLKLVTEGRFGRFGLPPDWLSVARDTGALGVASGWPPRFSYDAIRIPLYLSLSGLSPPGVTDALNAYWSSRAGTLRSAWVDLQTDAAAPYAPCPGFRAVQRLWLTTQKMDVKLLTRASMHPSLGYYSSSLIMLANMTDLEPSLETPDN